MLDAIPHKMVIQNHKESELAELEMETKSENMLAEIECLQKYTGINLTTGLYSRVRYARPQLLNAGLPQPV